ncbi:PREDICTED: cuticle protein 18.6-like [Nicrophorus vespilloides]|uniref:Cuticle protein 18.6-like n=1 Tax=Nicrophorus vespilloides TaxID=110193 RepID=A0ABM1N5F6_NICVS|nr:PREDICTED: cuticle protein 18.6-like [Nicrophorus vespilloides]
MFSKIYAIFALVAYTQAGVFDLGHGHHATSYSSLSGTPIAHNADATAAVMTIAPVAHYAAPIGGHYAAPVAAYHASPAILKTVLPVAYFTAPAIVKTVAPSYQYGVQDAVTGDVTNQDATEMLSRDTTPWSNLMVSLVPSTAPLTPKTVLIAEVEYKEEPIVQKAVVAKTVVAVTPVYKAYHH